MVEALLRRWWLLAGTAIVVVATSGPLGDAAHDRASAHMVQHVLLMAVAAPLLAGTIATRRPAVESQGSVAWLVAGLVVHVGAMLAWHVPGPYEAALRNEAVHVLEHASLLGAAGLFFWAVGRVRPAVAIAGLFLAALPGTALGAALSLAGEPWYGEYAVRWGGDLLADQQLAGVVMWAGGGAAYLVVALLVFSRWLRVAAVLSGAAYLEGLR